MISRTKSLLNKAVKHYVFEGVVLSISVIFLIANLISPLNVLLQLVINLITATTSYILFWRLSSFRRPVSSYPVAFLFLLNGMLFSVVTYFLLDSIIN